MALNFLAFYYSTTKTAEEYLRFVVCKTDSKIEIARDRLRGLKPFLANDD